MKTSPVAWTFFMDWPKNIFFFSAVNILQFLVIKTLELDPDLDPHCQRCWIRILIETNAYPQDRNTDSIRFLVRVAYWCFLKSGSGYGRTAGERGSCCPDCGAALEKAYHRQVPNPFYKLYLDFKFTSNQCCGSGMIFFGSGSGCVHICVQLHIYSHIYIYIYTHMYICVYVYV